MPAGRLPSPRRSPSPDRSSTRSKPLMSRASSTAISSPRTSRCDPTARSRCSTSVWRRRSIERRMRPTTRRSPPLWRRDRARFSAPRPTWRRSRPRGWRPIGVRIYGRSGVCCSRCSRRAGRLEAQRTRRCWSTSSSASRIGKRCPRGPRPRFADFCTGASRRTRSGDSTLPSWLGSKSTKRRGSRHQSCGWRPQLNVAPPAGGRRHGPPQGRAPRCSS